MKKLFSALTAAGLTAALLLSGCTGQTTQTETTQNETTQTDTTETAETGAGAPAAEGFTPALDTAAELSLNAVGNYGNFEALEQVILDFQEYYPHVTVTYEQISDYGTGLSMRFASGESVDLFYINGMTFDSTFSGLIGEYAVDLNSIEGMDLSAVSDKVLSGGQVDGVQRLLPVYFQTAGLIANVTLLEKYGLSVPTSYEELVRACDTLLANGITPIYGADGMLARLYEADCVYQLMNAENGGERMQAMTEGVLDPAVAQNAMDSYEDWLAKGFFNAEANTLEDSYNAAILRFFEGDVPFLVGTSDTISGCKKREAKSEAFTADPFDYTYFVPSVTPDNEPAYLKVDMFFGVYNQSENQDYANEFIRFMATEPELTTLSEVKGMPSVTGTTGDSRFTYIEALSDDRRVFSVDVSCGSVPLTALSNALQKLPGGDMDAVVRDYAERMEWYLTDDIA